MPSLTRRAALALLIVAPLATHAQSKRQDITRVPELNGRYSVIGLNADGSTYSGNATVSQNGDAVEISWTIGTTVFRGIGTLDGRVLTVYFGAEDPMVYVIMPGGALHGTWADGTALDRLTPM